MLRNTLWFFALCGLLVGCSGDRDTSVPEKTSDDAAQVEENTESEYLGTWLMYAGSQTGTRTAEDFAEEMTILILQDSTYTLTMMQPKIQLNFVESGRVEYDAGNGMIKFSVFSAKGIDFSGPEPRKLLEVNQVVPWERSPGTVYLMSCAMNKDPGSDKDVMQLSMEKNEDSFFVRMEPGDGGVTFDAKMAPEQAQ